MSAVAPSAAAGNRSSSTRVAAVTIGVAAAAMIGTLPGRTAGLGIITEPLLADFDLDKVQFANINLSATLLGALFCFPIGAVIDRYGLRAALPPTAALLGLTVVGMAGVSSRAALFALITLTRGLGQSALSVVSMAVMGKSFDRRSSWPIATFALVMTIGFFVFFPLTLECVKNYGWRPTWIGVGLALLVVVAPSAWLLPAGSGRRKSNACTDDEGVVENDATTGLTLGEALRTPLFWIFAGTASLFNGAYSGITLYNESILAERGLAEHFDLALRVPALVGLLGMGLCGWGGRTLGYRRTTPLAAAAYAVSVAGLALVSDRNQLLACLVVLGISAGMITVLFFAVWPRYFGKRHLGRIQGAAQLLTVVGSALGPVLLAHVQARSGSYAAAFYGLAASMLGLGGAAWFAAAPAKFAAAHGRTKP